MSTDWRDPEDSDGDDEETLLPEPDPAPGIYVQAAAEIDGDLRRVQATRITSDGGREAIEVRHGVLQLTDRGKRNLMIALYGDQAVYDAEARFDTLQRGPDVRALRAEVDDWRARFALLAIQYQEPSDEYLLDYIASATALADRTSNFPYGPHPYDWPPEVRTWFLAFTTALIQRLLGPAAIGPEPHDPRA